MDFRFLMKLKTSFVLIAFFILIFGVSENLFAQKVRLRSQITPNCTVATGNVFWKFSDVFADGNIAVQGSYNCRGAFIYDITNPDAPVLASHYNTTSSQFLEAIVVGNRGYFGSGGGTEGVHIVDLSNPYSPVLLGKVNAASGGGHNTIHEMVVWGDYLIENSNNTGTVNIRIINISNPAAPVLIRQFNPSINTWTHAMYVRHNKLYLSGWNGRQEIHDLPSLIAQAPLAPSVIPETSGVYHSSWNYDGIVSGNAQQKLTAATSYAEFTVSTGASEASRGERRFGLSTSLGTEFTNYPFSFAVRENLDTTYTGEVVENNSVKSTFTVTNGDVLRIAIETGAVKYYKNGQLVYTSQISVPTNADSLVTPLFARGTIFHKNTAINNAKISNNGSEQLVVWKTIDTQISIAGDTMSKATGCDDCNYLYSARETSNGDLRVYDISNPTQLVLVKTLNAASLNLNAITPHNPVVSGNKLYVAWYQAGTQIFDLSNPADPKRIGQYDTYQPMFAPPAEEQRILDRAEPWDIICGSDDRQRLLPTSYDGNWAVYPFLGEDKIIAGDMRNGLLILDASRATAPNKNQISDFDGDGKTDYSAFTSAAAAQWQIENSSNSENSLIGFGIAEDKIVAGDYDGDGKSDIAIYRPSTGTWWIRRSSSPTNFQAVQFGISTDVPVPGDYDADGRTDIAVWRPSTGTWYIQQSTLGIKIQNWGLNGDKAFAGDYDADGKSDLTIYRPSNGTWYISQSSSSIALIRQFGISTDRPLSGDFDGDAKSDFAVYRPSEGNWYILNSNTLDSLSVIRFGLADDTPIPADYDGDGKADISVFRPSDNIWYRLNSTNGAFSARTFGNSGDKPSPSSVQPQ